MKRESRLSPASAGVGKAYTYLRPVSFGELHPCSRCAFCGSSAVGPHKAMIRATWAPGLVCDDVVARCRRREVANRAC